MLTAPVGGGRFQRPARRALGIGALAALYQFVLTFPGVQRFSGPLDRSWWLEINRLPQTAHRFGRNLAFTYGPFGFLLHPVDLGHNLALACAVRWVLAAVCAALVGAWCARERAGGIALLLGGEALAVAFGLDVEQFVALSIGLLAAGALCSRSRLPLLVLAGLAAAAVFIKMTLALGGFAALAIAVAAELRRGREGRWPAALVLYAGAVAILAALLLGSPADLGPWLGRSLELGAGFSSAMAYATDGNSALATGCGLAVAAAWTALGAWLAWRRSRGGIVLLVVSPLLFIAFKHSLVRLDPSHVTSLFAFAPAAFGIVGLACAGRERIPAAAGLAVAAVCGSIAIARFPQAPQPSLADAALLRRGLSNLSFWSHPARAAQELAPRRIAPERPDLRLREAVGSRSLSIFPYRQYLCTTNEIDCLPLPPLQGFAALTGSLDRWMAAFFSADSAPDLVLAGFDSIDHQNMALSTPASLRALRANYRPAAVQPLPGQILLERRREPIRETEEVIGEQAIRAGEWFAVPDLGVPVRARISLGLTPAGMLAKVALRVPPVALEALYRGSSVAAFDLVAATAENGIEVSEIPTNVRELEASFGPAPSRRVVAIRFPGRGLGWYRTPVVRWVSVRRPPAPTAAR